MVDRWRRALQVAAGEEPADLILANGRVVNVLSGRIETANVAITGGYIVGVGEYGDAVETVDLGGRYLAPSFIDGHIHTESSLLWLPEFAKAVVPRGTGAVVTDPHEIVNVAGMDGFEAMVEAANNLPVGVHFTVPSCVPASPAETAGAVITPADVERGLDNPAAVGLGEMMNFPGVLAGGESIYQMIQAAKARGLRADGHAPGLMDRTLDGYTLSGMTSDHESTQLGEGRQKLERGMMLMLREGSSSKNMLDLLPLVTDDTYPRCCFASDDRDCWMLLHEGHLDMTLRHAVEAGLDPVRAVRLATFNVADYWRLDNAGAIAPGYQANLVVLDDLEAFNVRQVYYQGRLVAQDGKPLFETAINIPDVLRNTIHIPEISAGDLRLEPEQARRAVGAIDGQIVTRLVEVEPVVEDGQAVASVERDLLKLACVERHHASGNVGVGYLTGFGLQHGALASSIAHDAHNIIAAGTNDADILLAIETVAASQGGLAAVADGQVLGHLPLPVAGILSDRPLAETARDYEEMEEIARSLGSTLTSPFGLLAFLALSVIPEARVTDQGFVALV